MINLKNKPVAVIGFGKSGIATAEELIKVGAKVLVSESKPRISFDPQIIASLEKQQVNFEFGSNSLETILLAEIIVVSPGVHRDIPILIKAQEKGIPIISEIELAFHLLSKPLVAITGTNGKTTTTTLIAEMINASGKKAIAAGNIGFPLIAVNDADLDYIVVEISSYQLESTLKFKPWISVLLNIQEDHLERHGDLIGYMNEKAKIFENQTNEDYLVYNADDPLVSQMSAEAPCRKIGFTKKNTEILGIDPSEILIPGEHNIENALAAATAASFCGVTRPIIAQVLKTFSGVEHRIELVSQVNGVDYYNDSKATNPDSTIVAINSFPDRGIVLLLGGRDKGVGLDAMCNKIKERVKAVVLLGEAKERFHDELLLHNYQNIHLVDDLKQAVLLSAKLALANDVVLLSPACASFDMFNDFEERGKVFKQIVMELKSAEKL